MMRGMFGGGGGIDGVCYTNDMNKLQIAYLAANDPILPLLRFSFSFLHTPTSHGHSAEQIGETAPRALVRHLSEFSTLVTSMGFGNPVLGPQMTLHSRSPMKRQDR